MKIKKHRLFLWISLTFFALTLVLFITKGILLYHEFQSTSSALTPNDVIKFEYNFVVELYAYITFWISIFIISFILGSIPIKRKKKDSA